MWWFKDSPLPPLATISPLSSLGVLGEPGTAVVIGGRDVDLGDFSGGRFTVGGWLNCCQTVGFEASYFFFGQLGAQFDALCPPGNRVLARPFFNTALQEQDSEITCLPGADRGGIRVGVDSRLQGWEANALANVRCSCNYRLDGLVGFRFLRLDEGIDILERVDVPLVGAADSVRFTLSEDFHTRNQFTGGQVGARLEAWRGQLFVLAVGKVALGSTHEVIGINGTTTIDAPGQDPEKLKGALLALNSNIGTHTRDRFAVVPEVGLNVGYQVSKNLRGFVGYNFLYWSEVVRPGDQIDLALNPAQLPPPLPGAGGTPLVRFRDSDFFAHGVSFGAEFRY